MRPPPIQIDADFDQMYVTKNIPERLLLCALLERAVSDLNLTVANGHNNLKSAISWFNGRYNLLDKYDPPLFTYKFVADELRLSKKERMYIKRLLRKAEKFVEQHPGKAPGKHITLLVAPLP